MNLGQAKEKAFKKLETEDCFSAGEKSRELMMKYTDLVLDYMCFGVEGSTALVEGAEEITATAVRPKKTRKRRRTKAEMEAARG